MQTVYLISCAAEKSASRVPAEYLYCSTLFEKARAYVLRNIGPGDSWYILSAKHGLLRPQTEVEPYDETLNKMPKADRQLWSERVIGELHGLLHAGDTVVFLAGTKYREFLEPALLTLGCEILVPMRSMRIGQQLSWLEKKGHI